MINKCFFIGNVGKDPEVRSTKSGICVANFSIATEKVIKGEKKTTWISIVAWARTAEIVRDYVKKGKQVWVEGELQNSSWVGDDGVKRYKTEINAYKVLCLGRKGDAASGHEPQVPADDYDIGDLSPDPTLQPPLDMDDSPLSPGD